MSEIKVQFEGNFSMVDDLPVPTEVIGADMEMVAERNTFLKRSTEIPVPGPGTYLVRARLSSGELLSSTIKVAEGTADAILVSKDASPREDLAWAYGIQGIARAGGQKNKLRELRELHRSSASQVYPGYLEAFEVADTEFALAEPPTSQVRFGRTWRVVGWNPTNGTWRHALASGVTTGPDPMPDDNRMAMFGHISRTDLVSDTRLWTPLWQEVVCDVPAGPWTVLVALPPLLATHFAVVRTEDRHRPVRCLARGSDARMDALASYLNQGAFDDARRIGDALQTKMTELLQSKLRDPAAAVVAAYFLVRAGTVTHPEWIDNLANWFPKIADGPVLQAWISLQMPVRNDDKVRAHLLEAVRRGVPMYSYGLRLLYDGLYLLLQRQTDEELDVAFRAVRGVAAQADWKSLLTCTMRDSGVPWPFVARSGKTVG